MLSITWDRRCANPPRRLAQCWGPVSTEFVQQALWLAQPFLDVGHPPNLIEFEARVARQAQPSSAGGQPDEIAKTTLSIHCRAGPLS